MRLADDMRAEARKLESREAGYRMTGAPDLASSAAIAAGLMRQAAAALEYLDRAERDAKQENDR